MAHEWPGDAVPRARRAGPVQQARAGRDQRPRCLRSTPGFGFSAAGPVPKAPATVDVPPVHRARWGIHMSRYWSDRPLGVKLSALVAAGALVLAVFAVLAVGPLGSTGDRVDTLLASNQATGLALEADMMHDAVRADVLQALLSGGGGDRYDSAAADLAVHTANFRKILDEVAA